MIDATATEQAVIGAILVDGERAMQTLVAAGVDKSWFGCVESRLIFCTAMDLFLAGKGINLATVHDRMDREDEKTPTAAQMDALVSAHTTLAFLPHHIADLQAARLLTVTNAHLQDGISTLAESTLDTIHDDVATIKANLDGVLQQTDDGKTIGQIGVELVDSWQAAQPNKDWLAWPIAELNTLMGHITDEFIFLAALESVGKTAFALNLIAHTALDGKMASMASLESKRPKVVQRLIAILGEVNTVSLRNHTALESVYDAARDAARQLDKLPIRITDRGMNTDQLLAWAKHEKAKGSRLLVIDNMRHIRPAQRYNSPVEQFRDISVRLKWIRDDTGLPLIVLHHLTDDLDVSWSKDIRRDADVLMFMLHNETHSIAPTHENRYTERAVVDLDIRKNREGMRGFKVTTEFIKKHQRFVDFKT